MTTEHSPTTETYTVTFRSEPGFRGDLTGRLKGFLKTALRRFGLRCIEIRPHRPPDFVPDYRPKPPL